MISSPYPHKFSVAPMMDWTTSHCRQFHRLMTKKALLYTEMVTTGAIIHGDTRRFLDFNSVEHPIALQLGGHNATDLATCAKLAEKWGYDEVNLNAGCPSDRVQNGMIGAILMTHSQLVTDALKSMMDSVEIPITIKHRIGIDDFDSYEFLRDFVGTVAESGCKTFIVHARKAILHGLSPKENREIPPLDYDRVIQLKQDFRDLNIVINGGIKHHTEAFELLNAGLDGVMLGREAYQNPLLLTDVDHHYYGTKNPIETSEALNDTLVQWVEQSTLDGTPLKYIARHMLGLYSGQPGSKKYRRLLSENMTKQGADASLFGEALSMIQPPKHLANPTPHS
ncbi:tRNA dihydrouridine(20/20a) synthase DusA [Reinekea sp. G2M2-21]|uniref:tRNA dihydrouridine(20/20a) synthase DusA n=1 Tax=Reinekea sp. G2M2-21 TaxID=2788942 RepID=UPI0018A8ADCC|nr:tRNA dihydrouridine(20/20a) synthase DusA [Reinekea sp. G2M2-21]